MRSKSRDKFGLIPISIYTRPEPCGGSCIYCPTAKGFPKSYVENEDTIFALEVGYDPVKQAALKWANAVVLNDLYPGTYPIELIVLGGSFSAHSKEYRRQFIFEIIEWSRAVHSALGVCHVPLISVLTVESRPDQISDEECEFLLQLGVSKVEVGVQHTSDEVLATVNRGHTQGEVVKATERLKHYGFKVGYHIMTNLPGSNTAKDLQMIQTDLWKPEYTPDYLKIYPCNLLSNAGLQPGLWKLYRKKQWEPPTRSEVLDLLTATAQYIPRHVRVARVQRQFDSSDISKSFGSGIHRSLGHCFKDISKREGHNWIEVTPPLSALFIEVIQRGNDVYFEYLYKTSDNLAAIGRLRVLSDSSAVLREIKVFGPCSAIGQRGALQGNGIGSKLLGYIEKFVSKKYGATGFELYVNAAPGAKPFFLNRGYSLESTGLLSKVIELSTQTVKKIPF